MIKQHRILSLVLLSSFASIAGKAQGHIPGAHGIKHVLLISIDGMHAVDYLNCSTGIAGVNGGEPYCPNLATLGQTGVNYLNTSTSKPSDSFPGLMSLVTGGSPRTVGAFYDVAYDRFLAPPAKTTGNGVAAGTCTVGVANGTTTEYEEGIDIDQTKLNGGAPGAGLTGGGIASIDPARLIRDPKNNCAPVYPWNFVRTNTIFGVVHAAGGYTAWSDKHPSYSAVSGPGDGTNVDDYLFAGYQFDSCAFAGGNHAHGYLLLYHSGCYANRLLDGQLSKHSMLRHDKGQCNSSRNRWQEPRRNRKSESARCVWNEFPGGQRWPKIDRKECWRDGRIY